MKKSMAELMGVIISADQEMSGEKGVLEILYDHYSEYHGFGSPLIEKFYEELREKTKELPFEEADQFLETVNLLCSEYEHEAYVAGVRNRIRLLCELMA